MAVDIEHICPSQRDLNSVEPNGHSNLDSICVHQIYIVNNISIYIYIYMLN